jgi:hypothetical protein
MKEDDPEVLKRFVGYLEACAILLKPDVAYKCYSA